MPKSKRDKVVGLTKVKKKLGRERKEEQVEKARELLKAHPRVFALQTKNFTTPAMQVVREKWKPHSRFLAGKVSLLQIALGREPETEVEEGLYHISSQLRSSSLLLFTDKSIKEVSKFCQEYNSESFAAPGDIPEVSIELEAGKEALSGYPGSLEPQLRKHGLSSTLVNGEIHLLKSFTVAEAGKPMKGEQCKVARMLGHKLAEFRMGVSGVWERGSGFKKLD